MRLARFWNLGVQVRVYLYTTESKVEHTSKRNSRSLKPFMSRKLEPKIKFWTISPLQRLSSGEVGTWFVVFAPGQVTSKKISEPILGPPAKKIYEINMKRLTKCMRKS